MNYCKVLVITISATVLLSPYMVNGAIVQEKNGKKNSIDTICDKQNGEHPESLKALVQELIRISEEIAQEKEEAQNERLRIFNCIINDIKRLL